MLRWSALVTRAVLLPVLLQTTVCALRVGSSSGLQASQSEGVNASASFLPGPSMFEAEWKVQLLMHTSFRPLPKDVQLVLGIFAMESFPNKDEVVGTIKRTWMDQKGVCWLSKGGPQSGCTVYVAFVLGAKRKHALRPVLAGSKYATRQHRSTDEELVLDMAENMNLGKSYEYFRLASEKYTWATHIAKMDLDAFPFLSQLTWSLHDHMHDGCEHYVGRPWHCTPDDRKRHSDICPPAGCGNPVNGSLLHFADNSKNCWAYMQGGLYVLSARLAREVTAEDGMWSRRKSGIEDVVTGRMVSLWARQTGKCVSTWDPKAYWHLP